MKRRSLREETADLFDQVDKWSSFILANLLWCILSIPLITLPAATAGIFAVMSLRVRGKQPELFHEFFGAMRRLWLKATIVGLADLVIGGLVVFNAFIFPMMDMSNPIVFASRSMTIFIALALLLTNLYVWSLMVLYEDMSVKQLAKTSIKLVFAYPFWSIGTLIVALVPVIISLVFPQIVFLIFTISCFVMIVNMGTWRVIRRHIPEEELQHLEARHVVQ
ncbi:MAG TPA: DUF624 domain-containing protein [Oceanobacillus sp.]|nr:DUF624 domain-containing protein [Oceanobacillus sp.]